MTNLAQDPTSPAREPTTLARTTEVPVVSVLLPTWNAEGTIERALASVLEDRSAALECIVVDDGSTDRTAELAEVVASRDSRVVVLRLPENAGVSNARNRGLELVRGTWLTLLDADDRFLPGGLGLLVGAALAGDARAVVGQQVWWDGSRRWQTALYDIPDIRRPGRKSLAANPGLLYYVSPHAKLFHRSCFEGLRFSGRVLGDQPWIIRALLRAGDRIDVLGDTVYEWYRPAAGTGPPSITSTTRSSGRRGVEAAGVAAEALAAVAAEANGLLGEADRDRVVGRYVERLLRSDLGVHVAHALARRDPTIGELFEAVRRFVAGVQPRHLAAGDALARDILEPPLRRWRRVDRTGRAAYRELAATALAIDPGAIRRRPFLARLGLGIGLHRWGLAGHLAAAILLTGQWLAEGLSRRVRRRFSA